LIKAIQEQQEIIETLKKQNELQQKIKSGITQTLELLENK
jgi:hypothetical protein